MTFAVINWLNISINLLLVIFVIVCLLMTLIILMQRPKQEGLGATFGGGVTDQVFGARTTNVLQRGTVYLGSLFFILSLALAILIGQQNKITSTVTKADLAAKAEAAKTAIKPVEITPKPLSEQLTPIPPIPTETPTPVDVPADAPSKEVIQVPDIAPAIPAEPSPPIVPVVPDVPAVPAEAETPKDK
jgi:preprotein translocase subunit SecG